MPKKYDLIVVGAGSGLNVAAYGASLGKKIAVVEEGPMGGTCLNRGCIPSKIIIHTADVVESFKKASQLGVTVDSYEVDFKKVIERASSFVDEDARKIEEAIKNHPQYTLYKARASFKDKKTIVVGEDGSTGSSATSSGPSGSPQVEITADTIVIAAGTRPFIPPIEGIDKTPFITSTEALRLKKQPKSMVIIGGGYISAELGHFYGSLGTKITIIDRGDKLISNEDEEIAKEFTRIFSNKYSIILNADVKKVFKTSAGVAVGIEVDGKPQTVEAEVLFMATGRRSNADTLKLKDVGYELTERGYLVVDEYMRTNVEGVWALGDIVGKAPFKHGANLEASYVITNAFSSAKGGQGKVPVDYTAMPHAIFSSPQIAGVGLREQDLKKEGTSYAVGKHMYKDTGMGKAIEEKDGFVKVLVDKSTRKIVGCFIIGPDASTLIHEVIVAMKAAGGDLNAIRKSVHIHPALSEVVQRAVSSVRL